MRRSARQRRLERERMYAEGRGPLTVLLLGRTRRNPRGGIARSAAMIVEALGSVGDRCLLRDVEQPLKDIPSETDLIWHYGDMTCFDQQLDAAREAGVPMLVNSSFDGLSDHIAWMNEQVVKWRAERRAVVFNVFSNGARHVAGLHLLADHLVAVPKTIWRLDNPAFRADEVALRPFEAREGICLGDVEKLRRPRLTRGLDVAAAVARLRERLPEVPLYVYNQYGTSAAQAPRGVTVEPFRTPAAFADWLKSLRLYVGITRNETFAMVPAEAAALGTPVVYRDMPQSLSEQIGMTGLAYLDVDELGDMAHKLYCDERFWGHFSRAGAYNGLARSVQYVGAPLAMALRTAIKRARAVAR